LGSRDRMSWLNLVTGKHSCRFVNRFGAFAPVESAKTVQMKSQWQDSWPVFWVAVDSS